MALGHDNLVSEPLTMASDAERVLHVTVSNLLYPVTKDLLHQVFYVYGYEKIYMHQMETTVEASIQFQSRANAEYAQKLLHGRNIYDDVCCMDIHLGSQASATPVNSSPATLFSQIIKELRDSNKGEGEGRGGDKTEDGHERDHGKGASSYDSIATKGHHQDRAGGNALAEYHRQAASTAAAASSSSHLQAVHGKHGGARSRRSCHGVQLQTTNVRFLVEAAFKSKRAGGSTYPKAVSQCNRWVVFSCLGLATAPSSVKRRDDGNQGWFFGIATSGTIGCCDSGATDDGIDGVPCGDGRARQPQRLQRTRRKGAEQKRA
uniref:PTBP1-like RNA recognition motif 2 domain-containing protein n=1 Tax=Leersia perrieri TaxID=77586 RepID=A0A0D9UYQ5_9ORYZ